MQLKTGQKGKTFYFKLTEWKAFSPSLLYSIFLSLPFGCWCQGVTQGPALLSSLAIAVIWAWSRRRSKSDIVKLNRLSVVIIRCRWNNLHIFTQVLAPGIEVTKTEPADTQVLSSCFKILTLFWMAKWSIWKCVIWICEPGTQLYILYRLLSGPK